MVDEGMVMLRLPEFVGVQRFGVLPGGGNYVLSFVEVWPEQIVVRFVGLDAGASRELRHLSLTLSDDAGKEYAWRATSSGGMVLPGEVSVGFVGPLSETAEWIVVADPSGAVRERVQLTKAGGPVGERWRS
jgi:hypothetical protein